MIKLLALAAAAAAGLLFLGGGTMGSAKAGEVWTLVIKTPRSLTLAEWQAFMFELYPGASVEYMNFRAPNDTVLTVRFTEPAKLKKWEKGGYKLIDARRAPVG